MDDRRITLSEYLDLVPGDDAWAREVADRWRGMTPDERLRELSRTNSVMDAVLNERIPVTTDGEPPLWPLWKDPLGDRAR